MIPTYRIPRHPSTCRGVTSPVWDDSQCRLCWLATYDDHYRELWKIEQVLAPVVPDLPPKKRPIVRGKLPRTDLPCIHRGTERVQVPGCSTCGGEPIAYRCNHPLYKIAPGRCLLQGTSSQRSNARSQGFLICEDCGARTPEENLEVPLADMVSLLESSPDKLPEDWLQWRVTELAIQERLQWLKNNPTSFPPRKYAGRGIVIGAGGPTYFRCAWIVAHLLRHLGCTLPIEFWHLGPQEIDPNLSRLCNSFGITTVDAYEVSRSLPRPPRILQGWELKPFSVLHSRFEEVLYLDADCLPYRDPSFLFETPEYLRDHAIFWPDLPRAGHPTNQTWIPAKVWSLVGLPPQTSQDFESGQFLIHKRHRYTELVTTCWINDHSDYFYKLVYGDKSTYHLAWKLHGTPYAMPRLPDWKAPAIIQYDFLEEPLFAHACQGKPELTKGLGPSWFPLAPIISQGMSVLDSQLRLLHLTHENGFDTILGNPAESRRNRHARSDHERHHDQSQSDPPQSSPGLHP